MMLNGSSPRGELTPERARSDVGSDAGSRAEYGKIPRGYEAAAFVVQAVVILIVATASVVNISLPPRPGVDTRVWLLLLGTVLGAVLPNPKIKRKGSGTSASRDKV